MLHGLSGALVDTVKTRYLQGAEDISGALNALYRDALQGETTTIGARRAR